MKKDSPTPVLVLYTMSGFTGLLAEQGIEKYTTLLVGVTASASAVVLFAYFLGFVIGGFAAAGADLSGARCAPTTWWN